jgi:hypothetical protein
MVEKIWLERKDGELALRGYVLKRLAATDTTVTHLDVTLYDASGRVLRTSQESFTPKQLSHRAGPTANGRRSDRGEGT